MEFQTIAGLVAKNVWGHSTARLLSHREISTPSSTVFRFKYVLDGRAKVLFVKLPPKGKSPNQRAQFIERLRCEFKLATCVKSMLASNPEFQSVAPAAFIEEINGLVTWEVQGVTLQESISTRLRFQYVTQDIELNRLSKLAGCWLSRFHSLELIENPTDPRQDIFDYCRERLDALANIRRSHITSSFADFLMSRIATWIEEAFSKPDVRIVMCHHDFSPHNIIVTESGVCILDFSFSAPGLPEFDLACYWHKLEDLKSSLLRGKKGLVAIQECFLKAYGSTFELESPNVRLGLTRLILSKMLTLLVSNPYRINRWIENRRRYSKYLKLLTNGFEK